MSPTCSVILFRPYFLRHTEKIRYDFMSLSVQFLYSSGHKSFILFRIVYRTRNRSNPTTSLSGPDTFSQVSSSGLYLNRILSKSFDFFFFLAIVFFSVISVNYAQSQCIFYRHFLLNQMKMSGGTVQLHESNLKHSFISYVRYFSQKSKILCS